MEFFTAIDDKTLNPQSSTLVLPALSIGNVGQLAVDLLIATFRAEKVGYLDDPSVLPCVGNNAFSPFPEGDLTLPLEVFESLPKALTFIQQRSPVITGMMVDFVRNLASFAASMGKKDIIILSSLDSGRKKRIDTSRNIFYISTGADGRDDKCERLGWKKLEEYNPSQRRWEHLYSLAEGNVIQQDFLEEEYLVEEDYFASLPFAALFSCCKAKGLKVTCILSFCSEGDNIPDSFLLAEAACRFSGMASETKPGNGSIDWVIPFSWKSVYGPPPDLTLF